MVALFVSLAPDRRGKNTDYQGQRIAKKLDSNQPKLAKTIIK